MLPVMFTVEVLCPVEMRSPETVDMKELEMEMR